MAATSALPPQVNGRPAFIQTWRLALIIMAAANLGAFWFLLRYRYSPENYQANPVGHGRTDLVWIAIGITAAAIAVAASWRNADAARRLVRAGLVATAASMVVVAETLAQVPLRCLDPILFCTAWGWTAVFWLRGCSGEPAARSVIPTVPLWPGTRRPELVTVLAVAVSIAAAGSFVYYMRQQVHYLNNLALGFADCGEVARAMYNTIHNPQELFLRVNPDKPLFYDHFQPGVLPLVPLWFVWPDIKVTILLQVLVVLGCAVPIYWIGKELFQDAVAAWLLTAAWLVYPSTTQFIYSGSYGFRWGNLCLPLYFLALGCWVGKRHRCALLLSIWAILIKEEAAIPIGMFGLYLALFERRRFLGLAITAIAFAYFLVITTKVIPALNPRGFPAQGFFSYLGATNWEILCSFWAKPRIVWGELLTPSSFYFAALLLGPLLFLPLKKPSVIFVGSLVFLFDCLTPIFKSIRYQYQIPLLPVLFWALAAALQTTDSAKRRAALQGAVVAGLLFSIFFGNAFWSKTPMKPLLLPGRLQLAQRMARQIDPHGSLFASRRVAAHFITQRYLYVDPAPPSQLDYVLLDLRDSWRTVANTGWLRRLRAYQREVEAYPDLHLVDAADGLLLYARRGTPIDPRALVENNALPPDAIPTQMDLAPGFKIVGFKAGPAPPPSGDGQTDLVHVTLFSTVVAPTNIDLAVRCALLSRTARTAGIEAESFSSGFQPLGQGIWPIERWLPDKVYADDFLVPVPEGMATANFTIRFDPASLTD